MWLTRLVLVLPCINVIAALVKLAAPASCSVLQANGTAPISIPVSFELSEPVDLCVRIYAADGIWMYDIPPTPFSTTANFCSYSDASSSHFSYDTGTLNMFVHRTSTTYNATVALAPKAFYLLEADVFDDMGRVLQRSALRAHFYVGNSQTFDTQCNDLQRGYHSKAQQRMQAMAPTHVNANHLPLNANVYEVHEVSPPAMSCIVVSRSALQCKGCGHCCRYCFCNMALW